MSASTKAVLSQDLAMKVIGLLETAVESEVTQELADAGMCAQWDVDALKVIASLRAALADGERAEDDCKKAFEAWCIETANSPEPTTYTYPQDLDVETMFLAFKAGRKLYRHPSPAALRAAVIEECETSLKPIAYPGKCESEYAQGFNDGAQAGVAAIRALKEKA